MNIHDNKNEQDDSSGRGESASCKKDMRSGLSPKAKWATMTILVIASVAIFFVVYMGLRDGKSVPDPIATDIYEANVYDIIPAMLADIASTTFLISPTNGVPSTRIGGMRIKRITTTGDRVMALFDGIGSMNGATNALPVAIRISFGLACSCGTISASDIRVDRVHVYSADGSRSVGEFEKDCDLFAKMKNRFKEVSVPIESGVVKLTVDNRIVVEKEIR